jgi:hypothetical protein
MVFGRYKIRTGFNFTFKQCAGNTLTAGTPGGDGDKSVKTLDGHHPETGDVPATVNGTVGTEKEKAAQESIIAVRWPMSTEM